MVVSSLSGERGEHRTFLGPAGWGFQTSVPSLHRRAGCRLGSGVSQPRIRLVTSAIRASLYRVNIL